MWETEQVNNALVDLELKFVPCIGSFTARRILGGNVRTFVDILTGPLIFGRLSLAPRIKSAYFLKVFDIFRRVVFDFVNLLLKFFQLNLC